MCACCEASILASASTLQDWRAVLPAAWRCVRHRHRLLPVRQRGGHLCDHGGGADRAAARALGRGGTLLVPVIDKRVGNLLVWLVLATAPFWLVGIGGYVELGTRVLIYA